ncbi:MAG: ATP-dependent acyl-CoA ligase [Proteobacteria bacterium]|nr:ATP-dependent acyl-CoA ligase [Pseudomonadota bacterium]
MINLSDNAQDIIHDRVIHQVLKQKVDEYGNRDFFFFKDQAYSYEDLDQESDKIASGLQAMGIGKGDKVAIMMGNRPEFLFVWFGLSKLGAIEVPINTAHRGSLLTYMVESTDCRLIIIESQFFDRLEPILKSLPCVENVVVLDEVSKKWPSMAKPIRNYHLIIDNNGQYEKTEIIWSDPFAIMFTSGTTGPSKGALMPHNYAIFMGEVICHAGQYTEGDKLYNALPLFHGNAQVLSTMPALMCGAQMVLAEKFSASQFWKDIKDYGCTEFNYVGSILPILYKADPKPDDGQNPLRIMIGGGAPPDLFEAFEQRFCLRLVECYGMSEMGLPFMSSQSESRPGSCGKPRPDYEVKLIDDNGLEVGTGEMGELLIRPLKPYSILLEYYKMPDKTVEAWRDLWFHTGDYMRQDEDGFFYFVDRKKDALRRRGENISSYEVEAVINSHPAVLQSAAVPAHSDLGEDDVMVCLTLKPGKKVTPEELIAHCNKKMAYFMVPRYLRFMDSLPKTPTERVQKYKLREVGVTSDTWDREKAGYQLQR